MIDQVPSEPVAAVQLVAGADTGSAVFMGGDSHYASEWSSWKGYSVAAGVQFAPWRRLRVGGTLAVERWVFDGYPWSYAQYPRAWAAQIGGFVGLAFGSWQVVEHGPRLALFGFSTTEHANTTPYDPGGTATAGGFFFELGYDVAIHLSGPVSLLLQPHLRVIEKGDSGLPKSRETQGLELGGLAGVRLHLWR